MPYVDLFGKSVRSLSVPDPWPEQARSECNERSPEGWCCTSPDRAPHALHIATDSSRVLAVWATAEVK